MMKPTNDSRPSDLTDRLAEFALFGATDSELSSLTSEQRASAEALQLESLAALAMASQTPPAESLPQGWMERLVNRFDAESKLASTPTQKTFAADVIRPSVPMSVSERDEVSIRPANRISSWWGVVIAATAAAFVIGVAIGRWSDKPAVVATSTAPTLAEQFREIASRSDTTRVDWKPNADGQVSGFVVWNDRLQTGFMAFDSLPVNDPKIEQYQLWIFDAARDDERPVDGGVFDFALTESQLVDGKTLVPIDAKLQVSRAKMFALTVEAPGGVVVSGRERLPGLAVVP